MSNENNNGVIDFGGSTFPSENMDNVTNPVNQESASNGASNINVDDVFGSWDNVSSNTQNTAMPVSNDYNNSSVNFSNDTSKMESSNITPPSGGAVLETSVSDNQVESKRIPKTNEEKTTTDNSELTELAMNAFSGLTANGVSLESQEQTGTVASQVSEETTTDSSTVSENPDYMSVFANPFTNQTVSSTPSGSTTNPLEQPENTDASNLVGSNQVLESTDSSVNVISDFNGFSDTTNSLENVAGEANSVENSKVTLENNGTDFSNLDSFNTDDALNNQFVPNQNEVQDEVQSVEQVFSDNSVMSNPEDFSNQFATVNQETADVLPAPAFGEPTVDNQQTFSSGNVVVNPDMGTFNPQNVILQDKVSQAVEVQPALGETTQGVNPENQMTSDFNANSLNGQVSPTFNQEINNQAFNSSDNGAASSGNTIPDNGTVISPDAVTNLQQALGTPANNVALENSISVGSIPDNQVAQPIVNDNNHDGSTTPAKKQGKIGLPVVILLIIIVVSVGIIVLRRNELMDFFQTLMNK